LVYTYEKIPIGCVGSRTKVLLTQKLVNLARINAVIILMYYSRLQVISLFQYAQKNKVIKNKRLNVMYVWKRD